ncbi:MAG: hypothetical protein EKK49_19025 [Rhodocyclaceae bacterium]|nr:MAG: hypothetical protein EKK49_19025 [Rhodocyclaceae bacterium]
MNDPQVTAFHSEGEYRLAIDGVIALAQREICVFDTDLWRMGLEDKERAASLEAFLAGGPLHRIRVVVHDATRLGTACPRLQGVLRRFPMGIEFRQSPENLRHLADCLFLVDGRHGVIRFHVDHARGKQVLHDPAELAPRMQRFEDLWEVSAPCLWATQLGL